MDADRREEWHLSWMTGSASAQIENRKREAAELYAALTPSSDVSFDAQTLQDLLHILNHEYLCHKLARIKAESAESAVLFNADDFPVALSKEWVTGLLGILSNCLVKSISPTEYRERELQCRTLLTIVALLLAQKVEALQNDFHNGFHQSLSRRFQELQWEAGHSGELTQPKFSKVQCSYLLAATEEFSSRFRRSEPALLPISLRVLNLLSFGFAVATPAGGGREFNIQAALKQLGEDLRDLSRQPDRHYEAMFNLQELSILVNALQVYQNVVKTIPAKKKLAEAALTCAARFGSATLQSVTSVISDYPNYDTSITPPADFWQKYILAPPNRGPPILDTYYYLYGLVDCASQIARAMSDPMLAKELGKRLHQVAIEGSEATHRWKALEYLVVMESDPSILERDLLKHSTSDEKKKRIRLELEYIRSAVKEEVATYPLPAPNVGIESKKRRMIPRSSCIEKIEVNGVIPHVDGSCSQLAIRSSEFPTKDVISSGFSPDCTAAFSQTADKVVVVSISNVSDSGETQPMLAKQQIKGAKLTQATLSDKYLATITNKELRVTAYRHSTNTAGDLVGVETFGKTCEGYSWVPYSVAIHDARRRSWIAIAGETTSGGLTCGIIDIYEIYGGGSKGILRRHNNAFTRASRDVLKGCSIQSINFNSNGGRLVCVTNNNRILIWLLSNNLRPRNAPFQIEQKFTEGPGVTAGITSATVFQGPSTKNYLLGTTWPSLERHRNGGEWSFVSPIASEPAEVPKKILHKLTDLGDHGDIVTGAASPRGDLIALWEESGQIMILPMEANEEGGLKSRQLIELDQKKKSLWRLNRTVLSSMRFRHDERGLQLFVLGRGGTILYKRFENIERRPRLHSPRPSVIAGIVTTDDLSPELTKHESLSNESRSDAASDAKSLGSRLDSDASGIRSEDFGEQSPIDLPSEMLRKTAALSFTEERSVIGSLTLSRVTTPKDSLWRRTLTRASENEGELNIHDYDAAFQTYLSASEEVDKAMTEYTCCGEVFHKDANAATLWLSRPPRAPSVDLHSASAREIYRWLWYLQDVHARTMAGVKLLQDEELVDNCLSLIMTSGVDSKIAKIVPISMELLDVMTGYILNGLDTLQPHLDDPREMGLMEMIDALYPLKRVVDAITEELGIFAPPKGLAQAEEDFDTDLPSANELERFRLLTEIILLAVVSYPGSHATDFPSRHLNAECSEFKMATKEWKVSFKRQRVGCVQDFVQGPLWVFSFEHEQQRRAPLTPDLTRTRSSSTTTDLYLSTSIPDFADLFGRVSLEYVEKGQPPVIEVDWPGGTLRAATQGPERRLLVANDEICCRTVPWTNGAKPQVTPVPFDSRKRLLIHALPASS